MSALNPRNDYVLIRYSKKQGLVKGLHMPDRTREGEEFHVYAIGPKVENLQPGDKVLLIGSQQTGDWSFVPGFPDLIITRECNIVIVFQGFDGPAEDAGGGAKT